MPRAGTVGWVPRRRACRMIGERGQDPGGFGRQLGSDVATSVSLGRAADGLGIPAVSGAGFSKAPGSRRFRLDLGEGPAIPAVLPCGSCIGVLDNAFTSAFDEPAGTPAVSCRQNRRDPRTFAYFWRETAGIAGPLARTALSSAVNGGIPSSVSPSPGGSLMRPPKGPAGIGPVRRPAARHLSRSVERVFMRRRPPSPVLQPHCMSMGMGRSNEVVRMARAGDGALYVVKSRFGLGRAVARVGDRGRVIRPCQGRFLLRSQGSFRQVLRRFCGGREETKAGRTLHHVRPAVFLGAGDGSRTRLISLEG